MMVNTQKTAPHWITRNIPSHVAINNYKESFLPLRKPLKLLSFKKRTGHACRVSI